MRLPPNNQDGSESDAEVPMSLTAQNQRILNARAVLCCCENLNEESSKGSNETQRALRLKKKELKMTQKTIHAYFGKN